MIRRASPGDRDHILQLISEFYEIDGHVFDAVTVEAGLDPLLGSDRFGVVLVSGEPVPSGYAAVVWSYSIESGGPDALLDEIYVRERGSGAGRLLMEAVFDEVRGRGMHRLFLETETPNQRARSFYEKLGFMAEDSEWMHIDLG